MLTGMSRRVSIDQVIAAAVERRWLIDNGQRISLVRWSPSCQRLPDMCRRPMTDMHRTGTDDCRSFGPGRVRRFDRRGRSEVRATIFFASLWCGDVEPSTTPELD
jgi:hypothetical protein